MSVLIFDLDGTLIDSAPSILASFAMVLNEAGIAPCVPLDKTLIGPPLQETLAILAGTQDQATLQVYADAFKRHYDEGGYKETLVYPGVADMLSELHNRGFRMHLATNKRSVPTRLIVDHLGWGGFFSTIYTLDGYQPRLPDKAELLRCLLSEQEVCVEEALYVGDKSEDAVAAERNGLAFLGVRWGYGNFGSCEKWPVVDSPVSLHERLQVWPI